MAKHPADRKTRELPLQVPSSALLTLIPLAGLALARRKTGLSLAALVAAAPAEILKDLPPPDFSDVCKSTPASEFLAACLRARSEARTHSQPVENSTAAEAKKSSRGAVAPLESPVYRTDGI